MSTTATDSDPSGHHDWHSPAYVQEWIAADVLRDEDRAPFLRRLADRLPLDRDRPLQALDIGGGYGVLTRAVLDALPLSAVVLHDLSAAMLDEARERLAEYAGRVEFVQADLRNVGWAEAVGGPYDLVTSSMAIHNVRHASEIRQIYRDIASLVADGGCFLNIDIVPPAGPRAGHAFGYPAAPGALE